MSDAYADAGPNYLEQLLEAAVRAPAAAAEPASGRIAAGLLVALASKGEDDRVEPYLSWGTGRQALYEVRCYDDAERLIGRQQYSSAGQAIRASATCSSEAGRTARVVAIADDAEERWVMAIRESAAIYRIPDPVDLPGQRESEQPARLSVGSDVVAALRQLLAGMTVHVDATELEQVVRAAMERYQANQVVVDGDPATVDNSILEALVREAVARIGGLIPSADDIADKVARQIATGAAVPAAAAPSDDDRPRRATRPRPALPPPRTVPARTQFES